MKTLDEQIAFIKKALKQSNDAIEVFAANSEAKMVMQISSEYQSSILKSLKKLKELQKQTV